jgi:transposase
MKLRYSSDLTDKKWEMIKPFFTRTKKGKHLQKHDKRELVGLSTLN